MSDYIKEYFKMGLFDMSTMRDFVLTDMLSADDFKALTGLDYETK